MHPDQATEPIVDFALQQCIPFAVVPCCVYPAEFPKRKLDGQPVMSYDDFLAYLELKDPRIRRQTLDFEGRNIVLYWDPRQPTERTVAAVVGSALIEALRRAGFEER